MTASLAKGQSAPLKYSPQARQRIMIGVGWDIVEVMAKKPKAYVPTSVSDKDVEGRGKGKADEDNPYVDTITPEIGKITQTFDVDLIALMYNEGGELVDAVSPLEGEELDRSGKIYHSGDENKGISGSDDEIITVELKDLPPYIHHIAFLATAQSGHDFSQILNPQARIVDSMTNAELLKVPMGGAAARGKTAFIFAVLTRGGETGWTMRNVSEFKVDAQVRDWSAEVKPFLPGSNT